MKEPKPVQEARAEIATAKRNLDGLRARLQAAQDDRHAATITIDSGDFSEEAQDRLTNVERDIAELEKKIKAISENIEFAESANAPWKFRPGVRKAIHQALGKVHKGAEARRRAANAAFAKAASDLILADIHPDQAPRYSTVEAIEYTHKQDEFIRCQSNYDYINGLLAHAAGYAAGSNSEFPVDTALGLIAGEEE